MINKKISELESTALVDSSTIFPIVNTVGGIKTNFKLAASDLIVNSLESTNGALALSARQGNTLRDTITAGLSIKENIDDNNAKLALKSTISNPIFTGDVQFETAINKTILGNSVEIISSSATGPSLAQTTIIAGNPGAKLKLAGTDTEIPNPTFTGMAELSNELASELKIKSTGADTSAKLLISVDASDYLNIILDQSANESSIDSSRLLNINAPLLRIINLQTFADNTAAASLITNTVYRTGTGVLMIKY